MEHSSPHQDEVMKSIDTARDLLQLFGDPTRLRLVAVLARHELSVAELTAVTQLVQPPGRTWEATARAFAGLMRLGDVLDAGSGDGTIAQLIAPRARTVTCMDKSQRMLAAARTRLAAAPNVRFTQGDVHAIPAADASFDSVLLFNVLASAHTPARALAEVARVLRPGGDITLVTLEAHRHAALTATYGHVHAGFRPATLRTWLGRSGLTVERCEVTSREKR